PGSAGRPRSTGSSPPARPLDLRRFDPSQPSQRSAGSHRIRQLLSGYRLAVTELASLGDEVVGVLERDRWVLRSRGRGDGGLASVSTDGRGRVAVPTGVRHCLGLGPWVGISVLSPSGSVVIWPTSRLDIDLGIAR